jgi:predicted amidophosphoribosyltransferase
MHLLLYFHKENRTRINSQTKYKGHEEIGTLLGHWYGQDLKQVLAQKPDVIIPVPLHHRKQKERGYNKLQPLDSSLKN